MRFLGVKFRGNLRICPNRICSKFSFRMFPYLCLHYFRVSISTYFVFFVFSNYLSVSLCVYASLFLSFYLCLSLSRFVSMCSYLPFIPIALRFYFYFSIYFHMFISVYLHINATQSATELLTLPVLSFPYPLNPINSRFSPLHFLTHLHSSSFSVPLSDSPHVLPLHFPNAFFICISSLLSFSAPYFVSSVLSISFGLTLTMLKVLSNI